MQKHCPSCENPFPKGRPITVRPDSPWYSLSELKQVCPSCNITLALVFPQAATFLFSVAWWILIPSLLLQNELKSIPVLRWASLILGFSAFAVAWVIKYRGGRYVAA